MISKLYFSINFKRLSSFSFFNIEHVEYTISWPGFNICIAFSNKEYCVSIDLLTNSSVKFPNELSENKRVPLPLQGASSSILSKEKYSSIFLASVTKTLILLAPSF